MNLDLVDALRCPRDHEPSSLIATVDRFIGRSVDAGVLGCPVCDSRFPIADGGVVFDALARRASGAALASTGDDPDAVLRAAALLGLTEPGGLILLGGAVAAMADRLHEQTDVGVILHNPPGAPSGWDGVTPIYAASSVPLAPSALRGAMLDEGTAGRLDFVVAALQAGGRLVSPAGVAVPAGVRELARDDRVWVAERAADAASGPVPLRRARAQSSG